MIRTDVMEFLTFISVDCIEMIREERGTPYGK